MRTNEINRDKPYWAVIFTSKRTRVDDGTLKWPKRWWSLPNSNRVFLILNLLETRLVLPFLLLLGISLGRIKLQDKHLDEVRCAVESHFSSGDPHRELVVPLSDENDAPPF